MGRADGNRRSVHQLQRVTPRRQASSKTLNRCGRGKGKGEKRHWCPLQLPPHPPINTLAQYKDLTQGQHGLACISDPR